MLGFWVCGRCYLRLRAPRLSRLQARRNHAAPGASHPGLNFSRQSPEHNICQQEEVFVKLLTAIEALGGLNILRSADPTGYSFRKASIGSRYAAFLAGIGGRNRRHRMRVLVRAEGG